MRNIRLTFGLIFLVLIAVFVWGQISAYKNLEKETENQVTHVNELFSSAAFSRLHEVELVLDQIANSIRMDEDYTNLSKLNAILNEALNSSHTAVGYGFVSQSGEYFAVSYNIDSQKLKNLMHDDATRDSFLQTLNSDKMVIGRVYNFEGLHKWILPLRKAVRARSGKIIGVVTTGLDLDSFYRVRQSNTIKSKFRSIVINDVGLWRVYIDGRPNNNSDFYANPAPREIYDKSVFELMTKYDVSVDEIKTSNKTYIYPSYSEVEGGPSINALSYIPRYGLWAITLISEKSVRSAFLDHAFYVKLIGFFLSMGALGFLFFSAIHKEEAVKKELGYIAVHDTLTGLLNREAYKEISAQWLRPNAPPFAMIFMDLDNFKKINDTFGHTCGDIILKEVASRLQSYVPKEAEIVRNGGDEFTIWVHCEDYDSLNLFAKGLINTISEPYLVSGMKLHVSTSAGISRFPDDGMLLEQLMITADIALYEAKKTRNDFAFFNARLKEAMDRNTKIEHHLRGAIEGNELYMVYQPQISNQGAVHGVEALVRWQSATLGFVPPDQFIGVAEESGLIKNLGAFILDRTLSDFSKFSQKESARDLTLSINISVKQFLENDFEEKLLNLINKYSVNIKKITLEVTESLFINDQTQVLPLLISLRKKGLSISLDDFGTGYSSLSALRMLPIDELKIDRSFVSNIVTIEEDANVVKSIIDMGHNMKMTLVAEGVEEKSQLAILNSFDCDYFQGYYYSRPLSIDDLESFLRNYKNT